MRVKASASVLLAVCLLGVSQHARAADASPSPAPQASAATPLGPPPELTAPLPGFHEEQRPLYGLIVGGAVATVLGAFLVGTGASNHDSTSNDDSEYSTGLIGSGIACLVVGVPLLTAGILVRRSVTVPDREVSLEFLPTVSSTRVGGAFALRF